MRKRRHTIMAVGIIIAVIVGVLFCLYKKAPNIIEYDGCYYWTEKDTTFGKWHYAKTKSNWEYYLCIPNGVDYDDPAEKVPMVVTFHGQSGKYTALSQQGGIFANKDFQEHSGGCAVLVMMSRGETHYFSDPHSCARLIKNLTFKYPCLDMQNIAGYGFSQGAAFVVELAIADPGLFKAVISGSGYHQITARELISVLPVRFYTAVSENDTGIFEPGSRTGKLLARFCRNSRYVQYKTRGHFYLELDDTSGRGTETVESWLIDVLHDVP